MPLTPSRADDVRTICDFCTELLDHYETAVSALEPFARAALSNPDLSDEDRHAAQYAIDHVPASVAQLRGYRERFERIKKGL